MMNTMLTTIRCIKSDSFSPKVIKLHLNNAIPFESIRGEKNNKFKSFISLLLNELLICASLLNDSALMR